MTRFILKSLIIAVAFTSVWLSTFAGYTGSQDVRQGLRLLIIATSVMAVYCTESKARAFWLGFAVLWVIYYFANSTAVPQFFWAQLWVEDAGPFPDSETSVVMDTIRTGGILILATIAGLLGIYIYGSTRPEK